MLMVIPMLPAQRIEEGFNELILYAGSHNIDLHMLFDYYKRYWLRRVEVLSVYKKVYRTNNYIESFHNKLRQTFQVSHPNIWAFLGDHTDYHDLSRSYSKAVSLAFRDATATKKVKSGRYGV